MRKLEEILFLSAFLTVFMMQAAVSLDQYGWSSYLFLIHIVSAILMAFLISWKLTKKGK